MGWIDDTTTYPWDQPEGRDLRRLLTDRFDAPATARMVVASAGAPTLTHVAFDGVAITKVWTDVLDLASREGRLRRLLRYVLDNETLPIELTDLLRGLLGRPAKAPQSHLSHDLTHLHRFDLRTIEEECLERIDAQERHVGLALNCTCERVIEHIAERVKDQLRPACTRRANMVGGLVDVDAAAMQLARWLPTLTQMHVVATAVVVDSAAASAFWDATLSLARDAGPHRLIMFLLVRQRDTELRGVYELQPPKFLRHHAAAWCRDVLQDRGWSISNLERVLAAFLAGQDLPRLDHDHTYDLLREAIDLLQQARCEADFLKAWDLRIPR